jgi:hypothetical protein
MKSRSRLGWSLANTTLALAMALIASGCTISDVDGSVTKAPKFSEIRAQILDKNCTFACHSGGENAAGDLDLEIDPYTALINVAPLAAACSGNALKRIAPGDPDTSLLYVLVTAKMSGADAPCGDPMPSGSDRAPLTAAESEMIRAWIAAGALND